MKHKLTDTVTIAKAKMYSTAWLIPDAWDIPEGFKAGECVGVSFLRRCMGSNVFQCTSLTGSVAAISDIELERFGF
jgi:hypothetical protein